MTRYLLSCCEVCAKGYTGVVEVYSTVRSLLRPSSSSSSSSSSSRPLVVDCAVVKTGCRGEERSAVYRYKEEEEEEAIPRGSVFMNPNSEHRFHLGGTTNPVHVSIV